MSYPKGYNRICLTLKGMTRPVVKELKMDKYEYNVKLEQIKKLIKKKRSEERRVGKECRL